MQDQGIWSSGSRASQRSRQEVSHTEKWQNRVQQLKPSTSVGTTVCLLFFFFSPGRSPGQRESHSGSPTPEGRNEQSGVRGHWPVFKRNFGFPVKTCLRKTVAVGLDGHAHPWASRWQWDKAEPRPGARGPEPATKVAV